MRSRFATVTLPAAGGTMIGLAVDFAASTGLDAITAGLGASLGLWAGLLWTLLRS